MDGVTGAPARVRAMPVRSLWHDPRLRLQQARLHVAAELLHDIRAIELDMARHFSAPQIDTRALQQLSQRLIGHLDVLDNELPVAGGGAHGPLWGCVGSSIHCARRLIGFVALAEGKCAATIRTRVAALTQPTRAYAGLTYTASLALDELGRRCMEVVIGAATAVEPIVGGYRAHLPVAGTALPRWSEANAVLARAMGCDPHTAPDGVAQHLLETMLGWRFRRTGDVLYLYCHQTSVAISVSAPAADPDSFRVL